MGLGEKRAKCVARLFFLENCATTVIILSLRLQEPTHGKASTIPTTAQKKQPSQVKYFSLVYLPGLTECSTTIILPWKLSYNGQEPAHKNASTIPTTAQKKATQPSKTVQLGLSARVDRVLDCVSCTCTGDQTSRAPRL